LLLLNQNKKQLKVNLNRAQDRASLEPVTS